MSGNDEKGRRPKSVVRKPFPSPEPAPQSRAGSRKTGESVKTPATVRLEAADPMTEASAPQESTRPVARPSARSGGTSTRPSAKAPAPETSVRIDSDTTSRRESEPPAEVPAASETSGTRPTRETLPTLGAAGSAAPRTSAAENDSESAKRPAARRSARARKPARAKASTSTEQAPTSEPASTSKPPAPTGKAGAPEARPATSAKRRATARSNARDESGTIPVVRSNASESCVIQAPLEVPPLDPPSSLETSPSRVPPPWPDSTLDSEASVLAESASVVPGPETIPIPRIASGPSSVVELHESTPQASSSASERPESTSRGTASSLESGAFLVNADEPSSNRALLAASSASSSAPVPAGASDAAARDSVLRASAPGDSAVPDSIPPSKAESLYEFEHAIDRYWGDAPDHEGRRRAAEAFAKVAAHLGGVSSQGGLGSRVHPSHAMRNRDDAAEREVDDFGLDREYEASVRPYFDVMYHRWFRAVARDMHRIPATGRCILVANHAGALPWDGVMLKTAVRLEHPEHRELRWLAEDSVAHAPFLGALVNRLGAVRACPENAERLLQQDALVAVFPEGDKGMAKPYANRYQLQRFGRGGYVRLAIRTGAPIVPTAVVGSEETHPLLLRTRRLAKLMGLPFLPITPTFPWFGPLGLVPLPARWVILCGDPIYVDVEQNDPNDPSHVAQINDQVRSEVQSLVQRALRMRSNAFS